MSAPPSRIMRIFGEYHFYGIISNIGLTEPAIRNYFKGHTVIINRTVFKTTEFKVT